MPTLNGEEFVEQALNSIVLQGDPDVECIVIDGGSTDATLAIISKYQSLVNLQIVTRKESPNWVWSTNRALELAQGPFSCLLHQDDFWLPGRLAAIREALELAPTIGFWVHAVQFVDRSGRPVGRWTCPWPALPSQIDTQSALATLLVQNFIACPAPIFRTSQARQLGGLDETLWYTADWDFWLRLASHGSVVYLKEPLAAFRLHQNSQTMTGSRDLNAFLRQMDEVVDRYAPQIKDTANLIRTLRLARFSNLVNANLAGYVGGYHLDHLEVLSQGLQLGAQGLYDYLILSRIVERASARLRARVASSGLGEKLLESN